LQKREKEEGKKRPDRMQNIYRLNENGSSVQGSSFIKYYTLAVLHPYTIG